MSAVDSDSSAQGCRKKIILLICRYRNQNTLSLPLEEMRISWKADAIGMLMIYIYIAAASAAYAAIKKNF